MGLHLRRFAKSLLDQAVRWRVPVITPRIVRSLPHDDRAFTQGLTFYDGCLYESTGLIGHSTLRRIDPLDGSLMKLVQISDDFAEGIAVFGGSLYQLSWHSGKARVFRFPELVMIGEVRYQGEGWGLTSSPEGLIMSDGTSHLRSAPTIFE